MIILDDPSADLSKPVVVKRGLLASSASTDEGKELLLALGAAAPINCWLAACLI